MGVKYSLVHRSVLLHGVGSHGYSTREAVNSVKLCHIGARVADSKDKQKGAIASFVLGSDVLVILPTGMDSPCASFCYHCCCYSATDVSRSP